MHLDSVDLWKLYLQKAKQARVGLRMEMMNPMNYRYIGDKHLNCRLAFLSSFLDDATVREIGEVEGKFSDPCAAFNFSRSAFKITSP